MSTDTKAVIAAYKKHGSCKKASEYLPVSHSTVHRIVAREGLLKIKRWNATEDARLKVLFCNSEKTVEQIAKEMGRTVASVDCRLGRIGIRGARKFLSPSSATRKKMSNAQRQFARTPGQAELRSERSKKWHVENQHPKGMKGKRHSKEARAKIGKAGKGRRLTEVQIKKAVDTKIAKYGTAGPFAHNRRRKWKAGWRNVSGRQIYFRSSWEFNYAIYLESLVSEGGIQGWEYEARAFTFDKPLSGAFSYLPDFEVTLLGGGVEYHEVKGWMDSRSQIKLRLMKESFPNVVLKLIQKAWFEEFEKNGNPATLAHWER